MELEKDISQGCVVGIADIVFSNNEKVYLIDYKTGPIYSFLHGVKVGIKEGYKLQLLTYGYTYWKKGYKPENIYCVLQGLNVGENQTLTFTEKDYKLHEFFLENLLESINIGIEMGEAEVLATPSFDSCIYCEFNYVCNPLHIKMNEENFKTLSILTKINAEFDDLNFKINITTKGENISIYKIPLIYYRNLKEILEKGFSIFILGLHEENYSKIKYWTSYTKFYKLQL